jgi:hypothetical protein
MTSLFRIYSLHNGAKQILNLTKISSFTLDDKTITFTMDHEKNGLSGSFIWLSGNKNKDHPFVWKTSEDAKVACDDIISTLDNYYKNKNS